MYNSWRAIIQELNRVEIKEEDDEQIPERDILEELSKRIIWNTIFMTQSMDFGPF